MFGKGLKLKAFAGDKLYETEVIGFVSEKIENIVEKHRWEENADAKHFLLFPQIVTMYSDSFPSELFKTRYCLVKG